jgi:hypothetical protein
MGIDERLRFGLRQRLTFHPGLKNRFDALVGAHIKEKCPLACGLKPCLSVTPSESQKPKTGPVALLGVGLGLQDLLDGPSAVFPYGLSPPDQTARCPLQIPLMGFWPMGTDGRIATFLMASWVTGHPASLMKDLHRPTSHSEFDSLVDQLIGDAIVVLIGLNVVVDIDTGLFPLGKFVPIPGQGS